MNLKFRAGQFTIMLSVALILTALGACTRSSPGSAAQTRATPSPSAAPILIKPSDLAKLRWIEGSWRGTGGDVAPFYERYKFDNDSTLVVETLVDETLTKVTDVSRFELKDGHFGFSADDTGSVATTLDDDSITFDPVGKSRNSFRWQRESDHSWKALLNWIDKNGAPKQRVYLMERLAVKP